MARGFCLACFDAMVRLAGLALVAAAAGIARHVPPGAGPGAVALAMAAMAVGSCGLALAFAGRALWRRYPVPASSGRRMMAIPPCLREKL